MNSNDPLALLTAAATQGILGAGSMMAFNVPNMGAQIQAGLGVSVDDVEASEVFLLTGLIDDSGSIRFAKNSDAVREGMNGVLDALKESKTSDEVLASTRYLNGKVLDGYIPLANATRLNAQNYNPNGGTPLYDQVVVTLGQVLAKHKEFRDAGVAVRTVTVIVTDGADEHSPKIAGGMGKTAADCKAIVGDMLRAECHLVFFVGIESGGVDFRAIAAEMGIPDDFVLTPDGTAHDIRAKMAVVSKSAVRASQGGKGFSQAATAGLGGFGAP